MPYQPNTYRKPTPQELKARQYTLFWVSFAANVALLALHGLGITLIAPFGGLLIGAVGGSLLVSSWKSRTDSYYAELAAIGHRWAFAGIAAVLLVSFFAKETDLLAPARNMFRDPYITMLLIALLYNCGHAFAWTRDRFGAEVTE